MPTIDEAVEMAARAAWDKERTLSGSPVAWDDLEPDDHAHLIAIQRAALSAFLADVPVSEGMVGVGDDVADEHRVDMNFHGIFAAMSAKLAEEIQ